MNPQTHQREGYEKSIANKSNALHLYGVSRAGAVNRKTWLGFKGASPDSTKKSFMLKGVRVNLPDWIAEVVQLFILEE